VRETFEQAILDEPDDLSSYAAYADWLEEQGDPRGEFIRVQLALEDEGRPASERRALQARKRELLEQHERQWLGELAPHLVDEDEPETEHRWQRGFLSVLNAQCLTMALAQDLAAASSARFLRELRVYGEARYYRLVGNEDLRIPRVPVPPAVRGHWELIELIGAPCLRNLRVFQMGDVDGESPDEGWSDYHPYAPGLEHVVAGMPRVEELHLLCKSYDPERLFALPNLTELRVLRVYHLGARQRRLGAAAVRVPARRPRGQSGAGQSDPFAVPSSSE
jgi:uncharacterized protein (TIGR02996 family)